MKNVLLLSKSENLSNAINGIPGVHVVNSTSNKQALLTAIGRAYPTPDIVMAAEGCDGEGALVDVLCEAKKAYPNIRYIYLAGNDVDMQNEDVVNTLALLVDAGIYDIYTKRKLSVSILRDLIEVPSTAQDVEYLYRYRRKLHPLPGSPTYDGSIKEGVVEEGRKNVIVFSSVKPGTGKSFIATNIAADIARYGQARRNGTPPSVVIVEGDLQTLSVGTLLGIENSQYNLREALNEASKIVDDTGKMVGTYEQQERFRTFLKKCCLPYRDQPNLFALVGSQLNFTDLGNINPYQYFYMVQMIADMFDVVIVDSNSSLEHKTTGPILQLAGQCYYIIDLDFNNIRTNLRYRQELSQLGVSGKIQYVLNKAITSEMENRYAEKIEYGEDKLNANGFTIAGRIPMLDNVVVLNRMYSKVPIVYDDGFATLPARMEFCKLSGRIWPMTNALQLKIELDETLKSKKRR